MLWQNDKIKCTECVLKVSHHEFHYKAIKIQESDMKSLIWQYIDHSEQINQVYNDFTSFRNNLSLIKTNCLQASFKKHLQQNLK